MSHRHSLTFHFSYISFINHLIGSLSFLFIFRLLSINHTQADGAYGWHWQYLTVIGLTASSITFLVALLADITVSTTLFSVKNKLALCTVPLEVLISVLYWGLSAIDRKLVVPPGIHVDPFLDIGLHALPAILLAIDLFFFSPPWNVSFLKALGLSSLTASLYWVWVEHCFSYNGFYPYPIFQLLDTNQRMVLFGFAALLMTCSTIFLKLLKVKIVLALRGTHFTVK
ncbi:UPF0641 membrane protein [Erysiphe neolycopersici]|uniref:UPF0641 membrane protein n=1 Tax=Erysiphe neolycopersici TaxID=212602 RepID=A0A420HLW2_9PEZI|nr:UPF0641 membrane protein [Erysiphe neolycopersici]